MQLVQDPGHSTNVMGSAMPRAGIKPTSLAFWASVLTITPPRLPDVITLPTPTYLCQCRLLQKRKLKPRFDPTNET